MIWSVDQSPRNVVQMIPGPGLQSRGGVRAGLAPGGVPSGNMKESRRINPLAELQPTTGVVGLASTFISAVRGTTPRHSFSAQSKVGHESVINCAGSSPSVRWWRVLFRRTRVWGQRDRLDSVDLPDRFFDGRVSKTVTVCSLPFGGAERLF